MTTDALFIRFGPTSAESYPFWFENLRSVKKWRCLYEACLRIGHGAFYSKEKILKTVHSTMNAAVKSYAADNEEY